MTARLLFHCTFRDSPQLGFGHGRSGSCCVRSNPFWNRISTQSMIRMIKWGGFANFLTVEMCAALIVWNNLKFLFYGCAVVNIFPKIVNGYAKSSNSAQIGIPRSTKIHENALIQITFLWMRIIICFQTNKGTNFGYWQTCKAASASSKAGLAASNFTSAIPFSTLISSTMAWALSLTFCTEAFTFSAACALCVTSANT